MSKVKTPEQKAKALVATKQWKQDNPDAYKTSYKKYYKENREACKLKNRKFRKDNPNYAKKWREDNKEAHVAKIKEWRLNNVSRVQEANKKWRLNNKDREKNTRLLRRYGISLAERDALIEGQLGLCALCKTTPLQPNKCHVEHDHVSKQVRGITCDRCNRLLAALGDNLQSAVAWFEKIKHYLKHVALIETTRRLQAIRARRT